MFSLNSYFPSAPCSVFYAGNTKIHGKKSRTCLFLSPYSNQPLVCCIKVKLLRRNGKEKKIILSICTHKCRSAFTEMTENKKDLK